MKKSSFGGTILALSLLLGGANVSQAAGPVGCAQVAKPTAPSAGPNVAQAAPAPRRYSYQQAPSAPAPAAARPAQPARRYSYSPGYTNRANVYRVPVAPYDNSPRYLHADGKARGWHFRYSPTMTD